MVNIVRGHSMQGLLMYTAIMDVRGMGILCEQIWEHQRQRVIVDICRWCLHSSPTSCISACSLSVQVNAPLLAQNFRIVDPLVIV